jgi:hypothetical protein
VRDDAATAILADPVEMPATSTTSVSVSSPEMRA